MSKFKDLREGTYLSEVQYYKVVKKAGDRVQLQNEAGENVVVDSKYVDTCLYLASYYDTEVKKTKTELAQIFQTTTNVVMTVNFNKQPEKGDIVDKLKSIKSTTNLSKLADEITKGEERTMVGRHSGEMNELGRINFTDMEATGMRLRQVDPRNINFIIAKGVKYSLK